MRTLFRRSLSLVIFSLVILLLLLTPVAIFAQSEAARQFVELVFSESKSSVTLEDSVTSTAIVEFTHDGKDYQMKVPVTIAISETIPLRDSMNVTDSLTRVGVYGIEIVAVAETTEEVEFGWNTHYRTSDEHKLVLVVFELTNLSDTAKDFNRWFSDDTLYGIDDAGRTFENEGIRGCGEINPGDKIRCVAVFNLRKDQGLAKIEVHALAERTLDLPEPQEYKANEQ